MKSNNAFYTGVGYKGDGLYVEPLDRLRRCARPVIFATGIDATPYTIKGTAFMVAYGAGLYVITATHVVGQHPVERLLIFPSERSRAPLRLSEWWTLPHEPDDTDRSDLMLIRADMRSIPKRDRVRSQVLNLRDLSSTDWFPGRHSSRFFLFGYPSEGNAVDYEFQRISTKQFLLPARYVNFSISPDCHELAVENPLSLSDFDGLSGSPVCCLPATIGAPAVPLFCGMAIRGVASSERVHFLSAAIIMSALDEADKASRWNSADPGRVSLQDEGPIW